MLNLVCSSCGGSRQVERKYKKEVKEGTMRSSAAHDLAEKGTKPASRLRVQLDFSEDAFERLEALRRETDATSKVEVIRSAVRVYEWLIEQSRAGRFIEVQDEEGNQVSRVEAKWFLR